MILLSILGLCFVSLFVVEVFLGGALPSHTSDCAPLRKRLKVGEFFGLLLPLSLGGIALPMSIQHHWALWLVLAAGILHILVCRVMKAC